MESIFSRLNNYRPRPNRDTEEDFFTEVFIGVMERYPDYFSHFIENCLREKCSSDFKINPHTMRINTQVSFPSLDKINKADRPDIIIEGKDINSSSIVIFIENKIASTEGYNQLKRYARQLCHKRFSADKRVLIFITRFPEIKDHDEIVAEFDNKVIFIQKRWFEVYRDLRRYIGKDNTKTLINELLQFMEDKKITLKLGLFDLVSMLTAKRNEQVFWDILNESWKVSTIRNNFTQKPQTGKWGYPNSMDELSTYTSMITDNKLRIYFGFWFNNENKPKVFESHSTEFPILFVSIATDSNKDMRNKIIENLRKNPKVIKLENKYWRFREEHDDSWILLAKTIDLNDIDRSDNFADYFIEKFKNEFDNLNEALL